jgi:hypothetical protein
VRISYSTGAPTLKNPATRQVNKLTEKPHVKKKTVNTHKQRQDQQQQDRKIEIYVK